MTCQTFEAAGKTVGVSLDDMVVGLRRFDQALLNTGKGAAAQGILRELGVTAKDKTKKLCFKRLMLSRRWMTLFAGPMTL